MDNVNEFNPITVIKYIYLVKGDYSQTKAYAFNQRLAEMGCRDVDSPPIWQN